MKIYKFKAHVAVNGNDSIETILEDVCAEVGNIEFDKDTPIVFDGWCDEDAERNGDMHGIRVYKVSGRVALRDGVDVSVFESKFHDFDRDVRKMRFKEFAFLNFFEASSASEPMIAPLKPHRFDITLHVSGNSETIKETCNAVTLLDALNDVLMRHSDKVLVFDSFIEY